MSHKHLTEEQLWLIKSLNAENLVVQILVEEIEEYRAKEQATSHVKPFTEPIPRLAANQ